MRKFLLVVLALAGPLTAWAGEATVLPNGKLRLTESAAETVFRAIPGAPLSIGDGATVIKRTPNVTCTFVRGEDSGYCDIELGKKENLE